MRSACTPCWSAGRRCWSSPLSCRPRRRALFWAQPPCTESRAAASLDALESVPCALVSQGTTNLMTRALAAVGKRLETVPDPTQIHYHLPASLAHPGGWEVKVLWHARARVGPPGDMPSRCVPRSLSRAAAAWGATLSARDGC